MPGTDGESRRADHAGRSLRPLESAGRVRGRDGGTADGEGKRQLGLGARVWQARKACLAGVVAQGQHSAVRGDWHVVVLVSAAVALAGIPFQLENIHQQVHGIDRIDAAEKVAVERVAQPVPKARYAGVGGVGAGLDEGGADPVIGQSPAFVGFPCTQYGGVSSVFGKLIPKFSSTIGYLSGRLVLAEVDFMAVWIQHPGVAGQTWHGAEL